MYEPASDIADMIGKTVDTIINQSRNLGIAAKGDDRARNLEVSIYEFLTESDPENSIWPLAEGFGEHN